MKILLVTQRFHPLIGGAESVLRELAREWTRLGNPVTVLTARTQPDWPAQEGLEDLTIVRLPLPSVRFWGTWCYLRALRRWLVAHGRYFAVWYVSMLKHSAWAGVGAAQASGIPVVLRPEGSGLTGDIAWQRQALGGRWIARRCRAAAAFVALSPHIRAELEQAGYPADRIWDIANGVPIPDLPADFGQDASGRRAGSIPVVSPDCERDAARQKLGINASGPIVLFIGRLSPEKGLFDLLAAWDRVCAELPAAALVIVGDGPQAAELRQLAAKQASIHLAGATDQPQRYLRAADLFVLPSHEEGMSVALLEAMAAGVPAVACDIPGNRGLIESGRHGLLVPPRRPTQIAQAILAQLQARSVAGAMARAARERVAEEFSIGRMARRHLELFESLLQDRRKAEQSASS